MTNIYDRFTQLFNGMIMYDKYYNSEDVNIKFMRALPNLYDKRSIKIRKINDLDKVSSDIVYNVLMTYKLVRGRI